MNKGDFFAIRDYQRLEERAKTLGFLLSLDSNDGEKYVLKDKDGDKFYSSPDLLIINAFVRGAEFIRSYPVLKKSEPVKLEKLEDTHIEPDMEEVRVIFIKNNNAWHFIPETQMVNYYNAIGKIGLNILGTNDNAFSKYFTDNFFVMPEAFEGFKKVVYFGKEEVSITYCGKTKKWFFLPIIAHKALNNISQSEFRKFLNKYYSDYSTKKFHKTPKKYAGKEMKVYMKEEQIQINPEPKKQDPKTYFVEAAKGLIKSDKKGDFVKIFYALGKNWWFIPEEKLKEFQSESKQFGKDRFFQYFTPSFFQMPKAYENYETVVYYDDKEVNVGFDDETKIWSFLPIGHPVTDEKKNNHEYDHYNTDDFHTPPSAYEGCFMQVYMRKKEVQELRPDFVKMAEVLILPKGYEVNAYFDIRNDVWYFIPLKLLDTFGPDWLKYQTIGPDFDDHIFKETYFRHSTDDFFTMPEAFKNYERVIFFNDERVYVSFDTSDKKWRFTLDENPLNPLIHPECFTSDFFKTPKRYHGKTMKIYMKEKEAPKVKPVTIKPEIKPIIETDLSKIYPNWHAEEVKAYFEPINKVWYFIPIENWKAFDNVKESIVNHPSQFKALYGLYTTKDFFGVPEAFKNCEGVIFFNDEEVLVTFDEVEKNWYFLPLKISVPGSNLLSMWPEKYSQYSTDDFFISPIHYQGKTMKIYMRERKGSK